MKREPYQLHSTTPTALDRMREHTEPYNTPILGVTIRVLPGVWSPAYDWSGQFYAENLPEVSERAVLEIGCGTGLISVFAGLGGARTVMAVDVNAAAVECARQNFELHELAQCQSRVSDMFTNVDEKYDVIIFNAPYHGCKPGDLLERACADEGYQSLRTFFEKAREHLNDAGIISIGFSESGDLVLFHQLAAQANLSIIRTLSDSREGYNCMIFDMVPI